MTVKHPTNNVLQKNKDTSDIQHPTNYVLQKNKDTIDIEHLTNYSLQKNMNKETTDLDKITKLTNAEPRNVKDNSNPLDSGKQEDIMKKLSELPKIQPTQKDRLFAD